MADKNEQFPIDVTSIHLVLRSINTDILKEVGARLGGGTLIALLNNHYRKSADIDFICPVGSGYRRLREIVANADFKPRVLFSTPSSLAFPRDITADQYGIRFPVLADKTPIKVGIAAEARFTLNPPTYCQQWPAVPILDHEDLCTEKLLANADRWADTSLMSRDLFDLAVLRKHGPLPATAIQKAESAYPVIQGLKMALSKILEDIAYREMCFMALEIENQGDILEGISSLARDFEISELQKPPE